MGAGYINEETPETKALLYRLEEFFRSVTPETSPEDREYNAREVARICGVYREHRVEL